MIGVEYKTKVSIIVFNIALAKWPFNCNHGMKSVVASISLCCTMKIANRVIITH